MIRREALLVLLAGTTGCVRLVRFFRTSTPFAAFSLREARKGILAGTSNPVIASLAGMTRLVGVVRDAASDDIIPVGQMGRSAESLDLNDFVAALRALHLQKQWPLVSIDRTPQSKSTGKQNIRFEGVHACGFANKLLASDIFLKKAALNLAPADHLPVPSYFGLCRAAAANKQWVGRVSSRLWFYVKEPSLLVREDVAAIRELRVAVRTERIDSANTERDEIGEQYASLLSDHLAPIGERFAEVARLKSLFEHVAVAEGIKSFTGVDLDFWLHQYPLPRIEIPEQFDLLHRQEQVDAAGKPVRLELNGGIDTRVFARRLREGDHITFREAVLQSRPNSQSLSWRVPLEGWRFLSDGDTPASDSVAEIDPRLLPGSFVERQLTPLSHTHNLTPDPRGGVTTDIQIRPEDIRRKP